MRSYWEAHNRFLSVLCLAVLLLVPVSADAQVPGTAYDIDTYAGSDPFRDGGPATQALLYDPMDVAIDAAGNMYIADRSHDAIRRVGTDGVITTYAGPSSNRASADGEEAAGANLYLPSHLAVDSAGNVYFSEPGRSYVRRISPDGRIWFFAGQRNTPGFAGDGGPAKDAQLREPSGLAVDPAGNVYIADRSNHRVRRVAVDGTIATIAGTGERGFAGDGGPATAAQLSFPNDVAVDTDGNVYIVDSSNYRIRLVATDGTITTFAGNGISSTDFTDGNAAAASPIGYPVSVATAADGSLYLSGFGFLHRIDPAGNIHHVINNMGFGGDGGPASLASVRWLNGIAVDSNGAVFGADFLNHRIRRVGPDLMVSTVAGSSRLANDSGPATEASLLNPLGTAFDASGNLFIADSGNHVVRKVDPSGTITTVAGTGTDGFSGDGGPATEAQLTSPSDVLVDNSGNLYVMDSDNRRVRRIGADGIITTVAGTGSYGDSGDGGPATEAQFQNLGSGTMDSAGNIYLGDSFTYRLRRIDPAGTITTVAGTGSRGYSGDGGPAAQAEISAIGDLFTDASGDLYLCDFNNLAIRKIDSDGVITTVLEFNGNISSAVLEPNGSYLLTNPNANYLASVLPNGDAISFSRSGQDFAGDGGRANDAKFRSLGKLTLAPDGRIFLCDTENHRIRVLTPVPTIFDAGLVNAASFATDPVAPESIFAAFGWNLAGREEALTALPLPTGLGGAAVSITDSTGATHEVGDFYANPTQRNFEIPGAAAAGPATLTVTNSHGKSGSVPVTVATVAPGLFTMNSSGSGVPAATGLRVAAGGSRSDLSLAQYDEGSGLWVPLPIDLGPEGDAIYLVLYGTGIRGRTDLSNVRATIGGMEVPVGYADRQGDFAGLDQINIGPIPRSLAGQGEVTVTITVDGVVANSVTIAIQ